MSAQEFGQWQVFLSEEPIGPAAGLLHMAHLLAALANGALKPPQGRGTWRAADLLPKLWEPPPQAAPVKGKEHAKALKGALARMVPAAKRKRKGT